MICSTNSCDSSCFPDILTNHVHSLIEQEPSVYSLWYQIFCYWMEQQSAFFKPVEAETIDAVSLSDKLI